jgi:hypothetical protein
VPNNTSLKVSPSLNFLETPFNLFNAFACSAVIVEFAYVRYSCNFIGLFTLSLNLTKPIDKSSPKAPPPLSPSVVLPPPPVPYYPVGEDVEACASFSILSNSYFEISFGK